MKNSCDGCNSGMPVVARGIDIGDKRIYSAVHSNNGVTHMGCTADRYGVSTHRVFAGVAKNIATFSKCASMAVGCVAVNERGRIISTGVNGTVSGHVNCRDLHSSRGAEHSAWSERYEIHAEMNCVLELARSSTTFEVVDFYVTHCPCQNCLKHLIGLSAAGVATVRRIVYDEVYYKTTPEALQQNKEYCKAFGVDLLSVEEIEANERVSQL